MAKRRGRLLIGEVLRAARLRAGMTQEELAYAAGVDRTYISGLEHNHKSPTIDTLADLCWAIGVTVTEVVSKAEKP
jgi:transcriptional regulator with XRE-family HTH domain